MRLFWVLLLACFMCSPAVAAFKGPGEEQGVTSARQVLEARAEVPCVLEGKIIQKISGHKGKYLFEDASGKVVVEIADAVFAGRDVTPNTVVLLQGRVDVKHSHNNEADIIVLEVIVP